LPCYGVDFYPVHLTHTIIVGVGDIEIANTINRYARWAVERGGGRWAT
jgi:hypothetical protein